MKTRVAVFPILIALSASVSSAREATQYKIPLRFEPNRGQTDSRVKFLSRGGGYALFLTSEGATLRVAKQRRGSKRTETVVRLRALGARASAPVEGEGLLPGGSNYLSGSDPGKWRTNVPQYAKVRYRGVYPGIDLVYYGNEGQLEYDFVVAPGADPGVVQFQVEGADRLRLDAKGDLVIGTRSGEIRQRRPNIYQEIGGQKRPVNGRYALRGNRVSFTLEAYDRARELTIDPALSFATYLGGDGGESVADMAVDAAGNLFVAGSTVSVGFPTTVGSYDAACGTDGNCNGANPDVFVTKINPTGTALVYSTFIGGRNIDTASQIFVDAAGYAYVSGATNSPDFPAVAGSYGGSATGAFVIKLNPSGNALVYSARWSDNSSAPLMAVDQAGGVYLSGNSGAVPVTPGAFQRTPKSYPNPYLAKLNASGTALDYCTWIGGSGYVTGLAVDSAGNAVVRGKTSALDFPVMPNAYMPVYPSSAAPYAGFVAKLNASGSALVFGTYTAAGGDSASVATDSQGQTYVSDTGSVFKLSADGSNRAFAHSGSGRLYLDAGDNVYLHTPQSVSRVTASGIELLYTHNLPISPYYYSSVSALDSATNLYIAASYVIGPATPGAFQPRQPGGPDLFIAKITRAGGQLRFFPSSVTAIVPPGTNPGTTVTKNVWVLSDGTPYPVEVPYTPVSSTGAWISGMSGSEIARPESRVFEPNLYFRAGGVAAGTYSGSITVASVGAENSPISLPVSLIATSAPYVDFYFNSPLTFQYTIGATPPPTQSFYVYGNNGGNPIATVSSASSGWLSVTPPTASGSASYLTASANPTGLAAGSYLGAINLTTPGVGTASLPVRLVVMPSSLAAAPGVLSFNQVQNKTAPAAQSVTLGGSGSFTATVSGGNWLTLSQTSGTLPATVNASVSAAGLSPGTYRAGIVVGSPTLGNVTIPVTFVVIPPNQLTVSPSSLTFSYWPGATPAPQEVSITSDPSVNWSAFATSSGNWLSVTPSGGSTPGAFSAGVNASGLAVGTYTGSISVVATDANNSPRTVSVTLVVAASSPVTATPASLSFTTSPGVTPAARNIAVTDSGGKSYTATASHSWLSVSPAGGNMPGSLSVSVNPSGLAVGMYSGSITVQVTRADNSVFPITIPVSLSIAAKNELRVLPSALSFYAWGNTVVPIGGDGSVSITTESFGCGDVTPDVPWIIYGETWCGASYKPYITTNKLLPGQYTGKLTFTSPSATNGPQNVTVNLTVLPSAPVSTSPSSISFQYQGGALPAPQTLAVTANSATAFTATVSGGQWLSVSPVSGATPATVKLTADPTGLAAGAYSAAVTFAVVQDGVTIPVSVPVTLSVGQPQLQVSQPELSFTFDPGGVPPAAQVLTVSSSDASIAQSLATTVWTETGGDWLSIAPASGDTPRSFQVSVKPDGLAVGTYTGHVALSSSVAGNSPRVVNVTLRIGVTLGLAPSSISFRYLPGGPVPQARTVAVDSSAPIAFTTSMDSAANWVRVSPSSGATPANVAISVDPAGLPAGNYNAFIRFAGATALNNYANLLVSLEVGPRLAASPAAVTFAADAGSTAPQSQTVSLSTESSSLDYRVIGAAAKWFTVAPMSGKTPASVIVTANPAGLAAGDYSASVVVSAAGSSNQSIAIPVTLRIGARLSASQTSLSFQSVANGPLQYSQPISILAGGASLSFTASAGAAGGWLSVTPASGMTPGSIVATANPMGLVAGTYTGSINISATGAVNTIQIPVSLTVGVTAAAGFSVLPSVLTFTYQLNGSPSSPQMLSVTSQAPGAVIAAATGGSWLSVSPSMGATPANIAVSVNPAGLTAGVYTASVALSSGGLVSQSVPVTLIVQEGPQLIVSASSLAFSAYPGGSPSPAQSVDVISSVRPIGYRAASSAAWLLASPASGQTSGRISISVNPAGLAPGSYDATVTVNSDEPGTTPRTISVKLTVSALPQLTVSPTTINLVHAAGDDPPDPATLVVFSDARLPFTIQAASSGWLSVNRTSGSVPDLLEVSANPENLAPGVYTGTLTVSASGSANSPRTVAVKLTVKAAAPAVYPGGIVNTASYLYGAVAPGSLISIFGENLAPGEMTAKAFPWPTKLNDVSVTVNGIAAPLYFVSAEQINLQVPVGLSMGRARLVVTVEGRSSAPVVFPITAVSPGIFYSSETATGIQNSDYSSNTGENPAHAGDVVVAYLTGQGELDLPVGTGVAAPESPACKPVLPLEAAIDDRPAELIFGGMSPGLVGVLQVNVRIPDLPAGKHLLRITVGGVTSNSVPVYVSNGASKEIASEDGV